MKMSQQNKKEKLTIMLNSFKKNLIYLDRIYQGKVISESLYKKQKEETEQTIKEIEEELKEFK
jgi:hypothetical protein